MEDGVSMVPVQSVKKALDLLDILVFEDVRWEGISLSELSRRSGLRPNTTHNLLKSMAACGYVAQNAESKYIAGPKLGEISMIKTLVSPDIQGIIVRKLQEAVSQLGESLVFATLVNGRRVSLAQIDAERAVRVVLPQKLSYIYEMPTGRILVAYADKHQLHQIKQVSGLPGELWDNISTDEALDEARSEIREAGCAVIFEEKELVTFGCPVLNASGRLLGALGCYAPLFRCPPARQREILKEMLDVADQMSQTIEGNSFLQVRR
jgi:IclR family acetate operon transcriptional repressor